MSSILDIDIEKLWLSTLISGLIAITLCLTSCSCPECRLRRPSAETTRKVSQQINELTEDCTRERCGENGTWLGDGVDFRQLHLSTQDCIASSTLSICEQPLWILGFQKDGTLYRLAFNGDKKDELAAINETASGKELPRLEGGKTSLNRHRSMGRRSPG
jgi:hypothetical protein